MQPYKCRPFPLTLEWGFVWGCVFLQPEPLRCNGFLIQSQVPGFQPGTGDIFIAYTENKHTRTGHR